MQVPSLEAETRKRELRDQLINMSVSLCVLSFSPHWRSCSLPDRLDLLCVPRADPGDALGLDVPDCHKAVGPTDGKERTGVKARGIEPHGVRALVEGGGDAVGKLLGERREKLGVHSSGRTNALRARLKREGESG